MQHSYCAYSGVLNESEEKLIDDIRIFDEINGIMGQNKGGQRPRPYIEHHVYPADYRGGNNMMKPEAPVDQSESECGYEYYGK